MTHEEFIAEIEKMTVLELNDLVKALEEKFGVSAAAAVVAVPGAAGAAAPAEEEAPAAQLYEDGTWRAAFKGFGGPVMVALTLDDNLTIQSIQIGDDQFAETDGLGAKAKDAEFTAVFHMTDGDLTFAYSPYDSSFYYTVDEDGVPSLVNKNNVKTMVENYGKLLAAKTEDDSSSDSAE